MAERRMFSRAVVCSDEFGELSSQTQLLYFFLGMYADDDGFVYGAKLVSKMCGIDPSSISALEEAGFLIQFPAGIAVLTHWRMNNRIRADRYTPTIYQKEFNTLGIDSRGMYYSLPPGCGKGDAIPSRRDTQYSIDEDSTDEYSEDEDSVDEESTDEESEALTTRTTTTSATPTVNTVYSFKGEYTGDMAEFVENVFRHFEDNGYFSSPLNFLKFNESRGWRGFGGEDIRSDFENYAWEWEKNERYRKKIPLDAVRGRDTL